MFWTLFSGVVHCPSPWCSSCCWRGRVAGGARGGGGTGTPSLLLFQGFIPCCCEQPEVAEAAEVRFWCVAAPPAECSPCRRRGCGGFISQRSCVQARFPWDAWQPSAAPPALAALQPKMKFHFPLSSSRQFWFHCNNGADHVPVPLWDKLAGSASPNLYSPGPKLPSDNRAGMLLLGWQCQGPCPP